MIGLGNKGPRYSETRHNAGFQAIDLIAEKLNIKLSKPFFRNYQIGTGISHGKPLYLVKPLTYVNRSGEVLNGLLRQTEATIRDILIICDTLDLQPGQCRLKRRGPSTEHKGLASMIGCAGTDELLRIYIGIGRPPSREKVVDYVLSKPETEEQRRIRFALQKVARSVFDLLREPLERVMNSFNQTDGDN